MNQHFTNNPSDASFSEADRNLLKECNNKIDSIFKCLFYNPDNPDDSLIMKVDRNTRFRISASKVLLALVPTVMIIIYYLFTNYRRP